MQFDKDSQEVKDNETRQVTTLSSPSIPINRHHPIKVISLFSGCGGMDLGFEGGFITHNKSVYSKPEWVSDHVDEQWVKLNPNKFEIIFANDILREAAMTWTYNMAKYGYSPDMYRTESIVNLVKQHMISGDVFPEQVDIVIGGFPCQDFSVAGKRQGFDSHRTHDGALRTDNQPSEETRGKLYYWMKRVIDITKPKMFIAENVKGLANLGDIKNVIQSDFASADNDGYIVLPPQILHAGNYGVPESRERVFFIGIRRSSLHQGIAEVLLSNNIPQELYPYPQPTHNCTLDISGLLPPVVLGDIFKGLPEPNDSNDPSHRFYSKAKFMGSHCQGQREVALTKIGPTIRSEHHGNIEYRRLSLEHGGMHTNELAQGLEERRLTPRECALIQTFPPDYKFVIPIQGSASRFKVSASGAYKVIGNAVPPLLAYHIAKRIEELWPIYFKE